MSFSCPHCGYKNTGIEDAEELICAIEELINK